MSSFKNKTDEEKRKILIPVKLAHVVLRTNNLEKMKQFYLEFLGSKVAYEQEKTIVFIRYDDEHHRIGLIAMPHLQDKVRESNGLEVGDGAAWKTPWSILKRSRLRRSSWWEVAGNAEHVEFDLEPVANAFHLALCFHL